MRFIVQPGTDPVAHADAVLLKAMGMPGGGVISLGETHCLVAPGTIPSPNVLLVGPRTRSNAGIDYGSSVHAERAMIPEARRVIVDSVEGLDGRHLSRSLQGNVVSEGDVALVHPWYGDGSTDMVEVVSCTHDTNGQIAQKIAHTPTTGRDLAELLTRCLFIDSTHPTPRTVHFRRSSPTPSGARGSYGMRSGLSASMISASIQ